MDKTIEGEDGEGEDRLLEGDVHVGISEVGGSSGPVSGPATREGSRYGSCFATPVLTPAQTTPSLTRDGTPSVSNRVERFGQSFSNLAGLEHALQEHMAEPEVSLSEYLVDRSYCPSPSDLFLTFQTIILRSSPYRDMKIGYQLRANDK